MPLAYDLGSLGKIPLGLRRAICSTFMCRRRRVSKVSTTRHYQLHHVLYSVSLPDRWPIACRIRVHVTGGERSGRFNVRHLLSDGPLPLYVTRDQFWKGSGDSNYLVPHHNIRNSASRSRAVRAEGSSMPGNSVFREGSSSDRPHLHDV
jgi:hypothetical protein